MLLIPFGLSALSSAFLSPIEFQMALRAAVAAVAIAAATATATISVNATTIDHLGTVRVTYSGLTYDQAKYAWIGVYASTAKTSRIAALPYPASSPWTYNTPIKYIELYYMNQTQGYGHWDFTLLNMYTPVKFVLFTGSIDYPTAVATSQTVSFNNPSQPLRGHLGPTGDPTSMRVTWNSPFSSSEAPTVMWGTSSGSYPNSASASTNTYSRADMCGAPANTDFGWFEPYYWQSAVMTGLIPGATYYYRYGSTANGFSDEYSFTAMAAPNPSRPLNWCIFADIGVTDFDETQDHWDEPDAWSTMSHMIDRVAASQCSTAALVGDVAYATGLLSKWPLFDERISGLARTVPMLVGHGNHERDWWGSGSTCFQNSVDSGGECGVPVSVRYPMPWAGVSAGASNPNNGTWFSLAEGPLYFVMLNSELPLNATWSAQYQYLEATLKSVNRSVTPWLVVAFREWTLRFASCCPDWPGYCFYLLTRLPCKLPFSLSISLPSLLTLSSLLPALSLCRPPHVLQRHPGHQLLAAGKPARHLQGRSCPHWPRAQRAGHLPDRQQPVCHGASVWRLRCTRPRGPGQCRADSHAARHAAARDDRVPGRVPRVQHAEHRQPQQPDAQLLRRQRQQLAVLAGYQPGASHRLKPIILVRQSSITPGAASWLPSWWPAVAASVLLHFRVPSPSAKALCVR